ncbi:4Fe-4S dicluster domain-containing protein [Myxococcota bacterium]|nr:4Fe-4S dicluster domain-containing protein [Myxococcota bacterium]
MDRRKFLQTMGVAASGAFVTSTALAKSPKEAGSTSPTGEYDPYAILFDATQCAGCSECEMGCAESHDLPEPATTAEDAEKVRDTTQKALTVVNKYETSKGEVYAKKQCMHCLQPACASACLTKGLEKEKDGPVTWDGDKCMGCRFCMISCPFDIPKYEYESTNPKVVKCDMCFDKLDEGGMPVCVERCNDDGAGALTFGRRSELLQIAHARMAESPDDYYPHIYGEHEVGGTGWLYISPVPFDEIGFKTNLGKVAYPELTKEFLYAVPMVLTVIPPLLLGVSKATSGNSEDE